VPNLPVLALADEILGRVGALEAHLARHIAVAVGWWGEFAGLIG
jgi:hypothetical protein